LRGLGRGIGTGSGGFWEEGSRWWCDGVGRGGGAFLGGDRYCCGRGAFVGAGRGLCSSERVQFEDAAVPCGFGIMNPRVDFPSQTLALETARNAPLDLTDLQDP